MVNALVARLTDVAVSFGSADRKIRALDGVTLEVRAGTSTAIVGRSGSGKSTLMGILAGLRSPLDGTVELPRGSGTSQASIGVVFQSFHLDAHLTPVENCMLPWYVRGGMTQRAARTRARQLLDDVGLPASLARSTATLSGGERQRVAIARALFYSPRLLVADEPTGNLDEATSSLIQEILFLQPRTRPDSALVVVTHDVQFASAADRVLELSEGRFISRGALRAGRVC